MDGLGIWDTGILIWTIEEKAEVCSSSNTYLMAFLGQPKAKSQKASHHTGIEVQTPKEKQE